MKSINKETVIAVAPVSELNWLNELNEKLSTKEIGEITTTIKYVYPEIYQNYDQTGLLALLALYDWYKNKLEKWISIRLEFQYELNRFENFMTLYPQLQDKGLEIESDLNKKIQDNKDRELKENTDYVKILRSLQNCLSNEINKIISNQKELKKNNKATKAAELADPYLKYKKTEQMKLLSILIKEMRPLLKKIEVKLSIENVRELIEAHTNLKFYRINSWFDGSEYNDDDIAIRISENVLLKSNTETKSLGPLHQFKLDNLLMEIPKKYWLANHREMQIESLFTD